MKLFTIGHSILDFENFLSTLKFFCIEKLIDVRSYPCSRFVPQFNKEILSSSLEKEKIGYAHFSSLGGRRKSSNQNDYKFVGGWKNASFKNYASYTITDEYEKGINELIEEIKKKTVCIMCAESVPWKCHRLLISNTIACNDIQVFHIINKNQTILHKLNLYGAYAEISEGKIIYPVQKTPNQQT